MATRTIHQVDVRNNRVLMRVDFNVPSSNGTIDDDRRIRLALPSILSVLSRDGSLVLMSHRGRPSGRGYEKEFSLQMCAEHLGSLLHQEVLFPSHDCIDGNAVQCVTSLKQGEAVLLENLRFHAEEKNGDASFATQIASFGDIYCNEAFGTSHRTDASMLAVPRAMNGKPKVSGLLLQKEISFLSESLQAPQQPFVVILGGAKVSDKIPAIHHLLPKAEHILIGGAMAYTFLKAMGGKVGDSRVETERIEEALQLLHQASAAECTIHLPVDHVCATEFDMLCQNIRTFEDGIEDGWMGLDIGSKTCSVFESVIRTARTVVWNGPMGVFEWQAFSQGTRRIAEAIAEITESNGALTIVGGGDTASSAERFNVDKRVSHVSTGGGASLEMLSGKAFPSLEILDTV